MSENELPGRLATKEALEAVKLAAQRAAERCETECGSPAENLAGEIKWSTLTMLADQIDWIIRDGVSTDV